MQHNSHSDAKSSVGHSSVAHDSGAHASSDEASSYKSLGVVLALLLALTAATVGASRIHIPHVPHIWISLSIASAKAGFVLWYFMHLKHEPPVLRWFFLIAVLILAIFIGFTIVDVAYR